MSSFCASGSIGAESAFTGPSCGAAGGCSTGLVPSTGVAALFCVVVDFCVFAPLTAPIAAPAPATVPAPGAASNLMPSCGFHVLSFGKLVPGDVCLAGPVALGGGGARLGFAPTSGGGGGARGGFEANDCMRRDVLANMGDAWRMYELVERGEGRIALRAARGSIVLASDMRLS